MNLKYALAPGENPVDFLFSFMCHFDNNVLANFHPRRPRHNKGTFTVVTRQVAASALAVPMGAGPGRGLVPRTAGSALREGPVLGQFALRGS